MGRKRVWLLRPLRKPARRNQTKGPEARAGSEGFMFSFAFPPRFCGRGPGFAPHTPPVPGPAGIAGGKAVPCGADRGLMVKAPAPSRS